MVLSPAIHTGLIAGVDFSAASQASCYHRGDLSVFYPILAVNLFNAVYQVFILQMVMFLQKTPHCLGNQRHLCHSLLDASIRKSALLDFCLELVSLLAGSFDLKLLEQVKHGLWGSRISLSGCTEGS